MLHFSHLPTELLFNILFQFTPAESWPTIAQVSSWLDFLIKKCWESTKTLNLDTFPLIRSKDFQSLSKNFRDMTILEINCSYLTFNDIKTLPIRLEVLKMFNIDKMLKGKVCVFQSLLKFAGLKSLKLHTLDRKAFFVDFFQASEFFLQSRLTELDIHQIYLKDLRSDRRLEYPADLFVLKILNSHSADFPAALKKLQIWKLESGSGLGLNHETLLILSEKCKNIESLTIIDSTKNEISNHSFEVLINNCKKLVKLKLSRQRNTPVKSVNDFSAMLLAVQTQRLLALSLDSFQKISDAGIIEILKNNQQLQSLSLSYTFITDDSLSSISSLKLKKLALRSCKRISSSGLCKLFPCLLDLKHLNLAHAHGVVDEVLESIEFNCKKLEKLVIRQPDLSERFVFNLGELKNLKNLTLDFCNFRNFLFCRADVEELSVVACKGLDDFGLDFICGLFTKLKKLNLKLCTAVSERGVVEVCKKMKRIRYLDVRGLRLSTAFMGYLPLMWKNLILLKVSQLRLCEGDLQEEIKGKFRVLVEMNGESSYLKFEV